MNYLLVFGLCLALFASVPVPALAVSIDFEGFPDLTVITNQFAGATFSNAIIGVSGLASPPGTLNELEFPPHSGVAVALNANAGDSVEIVFGQLQASVSGFFTYDVPLTLTAFDALNNVVDTVTSAFASNLLTSGDLGSTPNELLQATSAVGIHRVVIDVPDGDVALDDLTFTPLQTAPALPAPSTLVLVGVGLGLIGRTCCKRD